MRHAIIDVSKSGGNPLLNLPEGTETTKDGKLWILTYDGIQVFASVIFENASRWVAVLSGPGGKKAAAAFAFVQARIGTGFELTYANCEANESLLSLAGWDSETLDGVKVWRLPHTVCGQSAFIRPEAP